MYVRMPLPLHLAAGDDERALLDIAIGAVGTRGEADLINNKIAIAVFILSIVAFIGK